MRLAALLPVLLGLCAADPGLAATASRATAPLRRAPAPAPRAASRPAPTVLPRVVVPAGASAEDLRVAEACQRGLAGSGGAVVAMDPRNGRVIAIVNPVYGLQNAYQPCSVFKVVVGVAGLSEGVITPQSTHDCHGGCWNWPGHGPIDLRRALAVSCNPFFQWVGEQLGYDRVERYARLFGLGERSGINLAGESPGRFPPPVAPAGIPLLSSHAQGIATTGLQLAVLISAVIDGGVVWQPQLAPAEGFVPKERWRLPAGTVLAPMLDGFIGSVNEGSGIPAFDPEVNVAGKTGTCAGVGWFASYAPFDRPEIVIVAFTRPGSGHTASAVAGRVYQALYRPQPPQLVSGPLAGLR
jgi:cell division protein FtsI/penicillin-binding protein 2